MFNKLSLSAICLCLCASTWAAPAPWFWWASRIDGARVCLQTAPGAGWQRIGIPYRDAHCKRPADPR